MGGLGVDVLFSEKEKLQLLAKDYCQLFLHLAQFCLTKDKEGEGGGGVQNKLTNPLKNKNTRREEGVKGWCHRRRTGSREQKSVTQSRRDSLSGAKTEVMHFGGSPLRPKRKGKRAPPEGRAGGKSGT